MTTFETGLISHRSLDRPTTMAICTSGFWNGQKTGRYGWIFGQTQKDTFSLDGEIVGFDLTGILDSESEKERMAVLSYLFRRVERKIEDRKPTIIVIDEAWKALGQSLFR